jgi:hypothetical protein
LGRHWEVTERFSNQVIHEYVIAEAPALGTGISASRKASTRIFFGKQKALLLFVIVHQR